ncbi:MAG: large conductance mechanosensitive channel protein MscL [Ruminococcaceae bacterium]|nr:large conductance mechanosensitive channel protein MscL [Oscillospiraceae bacterium]
MKKFLEEFKAFINRGNVVDMAVGVIIGAAFKAIVDSVVNDLISPIIGIIFRKDFSNLVIQIFDAQIRYGAFIMAVINFFIVAAALFALIKVINLFHRKKEEAPAPVTTKVCPYCKSEISIEATRCPHCTSEV